MKKFLLAALMVLCCYAGFSQTDLIVHSNDKGLYINHVVSAKENFYSIGRLYAISPKDIAAFNALDMNNGLNIGQTIMIPLSVLNFSQSTQVGTPLYYVVGEKEGLYRVSLKNNKVLMANLRKWNNLKSDNIAPGQKLVVGYLVATNVPSTNQAIAKSDTKEPAAQPQVTTQQRTEPTETRNTETRTTANNTSNRTAPVAMGGAGYFKNQFEIQSKKNSAGKDQTATAGIFKTASGWQDGKYYALIDNVEPGTIIRITNPTNNKAIYAKVLGEMSGIRQNQGLEVRISNAAASALEVPEPDKFIVRVNY